MHAQLMDSYFIYMYRYTKYMLVQVQTTNVVHAPISSTIHIAI